MSVLLETSVGDITIDLYTKECPLATKNFLKLCNIKYYNNSLFENVQKNYLTEIKSKKEATSIYEMLYGQQAKYFDDEINNNITHAQIGTVATSNIAPNKNDSNFYITLSNEPIQRLDKKHTIFGQVVEGFENLLKLNDVHLDKDDRPYKNIRILHTLVIEDPFEDIDQLIEENNLIPSRSPSLSVDPNRLEYNDDIIGEEDQNELQKKTKDWENKAKEINLEILGDKLDADLTPPENILFVCKLNAVTQEQDLDTIFSRFGNIRNCNIVRDWKTGQSLQYAFIEFETIQTCENAYFSMEGALIDERRIHVDFCQSVQKMYTTFRKNQNIMNKQNEENDKKEQIQLKKQNQRGGYKIINEGHYIQPEKYRSRSRSKKKKDKRSRSISRDQKQKRLRSRSQGKSKKSKKDKKIKRHHR